LMHLAISGRKIDMTYDVLVVGGSYAGLAAALQVARARRRVAVIDSGCRRNRFAARAYGLLGHDGEDPGDILDKARADLQKYPTYTLIRGSAVTAERSDIGFEVRTEAGAVLQARRVVLAVGVTDELPDIPGLAERWGQTAFHCPYCHAYELADGELGVLATGLMSAHTALLLPDWAKTTFFTRGLFDLSDEQTTALDRRGVTIEREPVTQLSGGEGQVCVHLGDGRIVELSGIHVASKTKVASTLAAQLGCAFDDGPLGSYVKVDEMQETTVPGVFACGDMSMPANVSVAIGDGSLAGLMVHHSLVAGDHQPLRVAVL
jgi:thioredoxin reductase